MAEDLERLLAAAARARDAHRLDEAAQHYAAALAVCRVNGDALRVAHTARHLGDIQRERGLHDQAEALFEDAIALYRGSTETKVLDLANALRPLALLHETLGNAERAGRLWREARTLYAAINVTAGVSECDARLAARGRP
jgi:tetratricopeptide (TPR) repeat protein